MCTTTDHYAVCSSTFKNMCGFLRTVDISVCKNRNGYGGFYLPNGFVFREAAIGARAGAAVHGQRGDARLFGNARNQHTVAVFRVPTCAHFQCHGYCNRVNHGVEYARHQFRVAHQRRSGQAAADFFCRAAKIDVDGRGAESSGVARRVGHHCRLAARNLHDVRRRIRAKIQPVTALVRVPQAGVRNGHLAGRQARAPVAAQAAKGRISDAGHRRQQGWAGQCHAADCYGSCHGW